jgi:methyl-accepting chemotaxis protein
MTAETPNASKGMAAAITREDAGKLDALDRAFALIEFDLEGKILWANQNFLDLVGYGAHEIIGRHHRIFCDKAYVATSSYRKFWQHLGQGKFHQGEFKRLRKDGHEVYIQASYTPVLDETGHPYKILKVAMDVTGQRLAMIEAECKLAAIDRTTAIAEFDLLGNFLNANRAFLMAMGYELEELKGQHHRVLFSPPMPPARNMPPSGANWPTAKAPAASIAIRQRAAAMCGSGPAITRSSTSMSSPAKSWSMPRTSPRATPAVWT